MTGAATGVSSSRVPGAWLAERSWGPAPRSAVLLHAPSHVFQAPGGGENQLVQTGRHVEALGIPVRPFQPWVDSIREARALHLFGVSREGLELATLARAVGVPVVLSPIIWYEPRAILALAPHPLAAARDLAKWAAQTAFPRWPRWRRTLLNLADAVLPNSHAEALQLIRLFDVDPARVRVVPNGVEPRFRQADSDLWRERFGRDPFVLYTGRIEPRKNVDGLIRAARSAGLPLTVIGDAPPSQRAYRDDCVRSGGDAVRWLPALGHDDPLLASAYAAARVVALPSWFETPGLSVLEGALAGAAVLVTPFGSASEYFGGLATYARPDRPSEVARALRLAWDSGADPRLAAHVEGRFLWSHVARRTAEVYDQVTG